MRERAPAKVNLSLLVGPPGADGYHPLFTVFAPVDLYDDLEFDLVVTPPGEGRRGGGPPPVPAPVPSGFDVECPGVPPQINLVTRALRALEGETGWLFSGRVRVQKGIPTGAGMGGGSADCACTLAVGARLIAAAGGPELGGAVLERIALALGADVPFFLHPRPALASGVGERLERLTLPELPLVVLLPEGELSTAEVYRTFDGVAASESQRAFLARSRQAENAWRALAAAWASGAVARSTFCTRVAGMLHNDLERASMHLLPRLSARKTLLQRHGALGALMSGSGPTVFGLCASNAAASRIARALEAEGLPSRPARAAPRQLTGR